MLKRKLSRGKIINDIILTLSLIISLVLVKTIMELTGLGFTEGRMWIFFIGVFVSIKAFYNILTKLARKIFKQIN